MAVLLFLFSLLPSTIYGFAVLGYLPEWRYHAANYVTLSHHLTHLIFFSAEPLPSGELTGLDRLPSAAVLAEARAAAAATGTQLLFCFGGNGRSGGFSEVVRSPQKTARFAAAAAALVKQRGVHGVDINYEYPGYTFGTGYAPDAEVERDYAGLARLLAALRAALPPGAPLTLAYYPDGRQEALLLKHGAHEHVDFMHMMTYDQSGGPHAPRDFALRAMDGGLAAGLPRGKLTLGLPFYGRSSASGDWTTYEDLVQRHAPLRADADAAPGSKKGEVVHFNGRATIAQKVRDARARGLGGVMVWEAGQDCRLAAVTRGGQTHGVTCPEGEASSLLFALSAAVAECEAAAVEEL